MRKASLVLKCRNLISTTLFARKYLSCQAEAKANYEEQSIWDQGAASFMDLSLKVIFTASLEPFDLIIYLQHLKNLNFVPVACAVSLIKLNRLGRIKKGFEIALWMERLWPYF